MKRRVRRGELKDVALLAGREPVARGNAAVGSDPSFQSRVDKGAAERNGFAEREKTLLILALRILPQPRIEPDRGFRIPDRNR